jgi:hypothetical protein
VNDNIRPDYYNPDSPYEPRKVIHAWDAGFNLGNALKYISRAGKKKGSSRLDDLRKALTFIQFEIDTEIERGATRS